MANALDMLSKIESDLDTAELGLARSLEIIRRVQTMIEAMDLNLRQPEEKHWLLFPLDITWPVSGEFGVMYAIGGATWQHEGIDFACPTGCGVRACASGVVRFAGIKDGYGNFVQVEHQHRDRSWKTGYAHLGTIECRAGQSIIAKQFLGLSGETGNISGAHLHLTVWSPDSTFKPIGCTEYLRGVINPRDVLQWPPTLT